MEPSHLDMAWSSIVLWKPHPIAGWGRVYRAQLRASRQDTHRDAIRTHKPAFCRLCLKSDLIWRPILLQSCPFSSMFPGLTVRSLEPLLVNGLHTIPSASASGQAGPGHGEEPSALLQWAQAQGFLPSSRSTSQQLTSVPAPWSSQPCTVTGPHATSYRLEGHLC